MRGFERGRRGADKAVKNNVKKHNDVKDNTLLNTVIAICAAFFVGSAMLVLLPVIFVLKMASVLSEDWQTGGEYD